MASFTKMFLWWQICVTVQIALSVTCGASSPVGRAFLVADSWGYHGHPFSTTMIYQIHKNNKGNGKFWAVGVYFRLGLCYTEEKTNGGTL